MQRLIADAGYIPKQRRQDYSVIDASGNGKRETGKEKQ